MKNGMPFLCELLFCVVSLGMYGGDVQISPTGKMPEPWVSMTIPGGKSLQDVFDWFAKVEQEGASGLKFQVMRSKDDSIRMVVDVDEEVEEDWACLSPTNPVAVLSKERKRFWVPGVVIDIAVDDELLQVDGCAWLSNAVHKVYVRRSQESEFSKTVEVDRYVVSPDLHKAYYLEGKTDVDYPFPFVNSTPDLTREDLSNRRDAIEMKEDALRMAQRYRAAVGKVELNSRYRVMRGSGNSFGYVVFDDSDSFFCAEYHPERGKENAGVALCRSQCKENRHRVIWLGADGSLRDYEIAEQDVLSKILSEAVQISFAREVLTRLKLTAADLPGINLDAVLGQPEAKK